MGPFEHHRRAPGPFTERAERTIMDSRPRGAYRSIGVSIHPRGARPGCVMARWPLAGNARLGILANRRRRDAWPVLMWRCSARPHAHDDTGLPHALYSSPTIQRGITHPKDTSMSPAPLMCLLSACSFRLEPYGDFSFGQPN